MKSKVARLLFPALLLCLLAAPLSAQDMSQYMHEFEKHITVKTLPNGLTLLVMERPQAPVFSFFTHVDAGSVQDPKGKSGLAHMFEHMAFKGTTTIGTTDYAKEKVALDKVEAAYQAYNRERLKTTGRDEKKLAALEKAWRDAIAEADKYVVENEFGQIIEQNGGENLNAFTAADDTNYFYSLPANRTELWAYLESERFLHPVFREFYKERDVVHEERRLRVDSEPIGRLVEQFVNLAFLAHPYHNEGIGWPSELDNFSETDAENFYTKYYVPANMVTAVVGDVNRAQFIPMAEKYLGRLPAGKGKPIDDSVVEEPQIGERQVIIKEASQPIYLEGYHRPDSRDPDAATYDVIADLMSKGRVSRLYRSLVRDQKIALFAQGGNYFPGDKYPTLFFFFAVPNRGKTPEELRVAFHQEIDRLKSEDVTDEELASVKTRAKADLIRGLADNDDLAQALATAQARFGDWREVFRQIDRMDKVTKADIRRVANKTFVESNRTVAIIETEAPAQGGKQ
jgi:predicted Zn-dependent peptidase